MGFGRTIIHCNLNLQHQIKYAQAVKNGFRRHGIEASIGKTNQDGDTHVIIGNWFAPQWKGINGTLMLDRAYWKDPDYVSVHWIYRKEKQFERINDFREHPEPAPYKTGDRKIYLCDYGDKIKSMSGMSIRWHPAQVPIQKPLIESLNEHDIAIGKRTTALVNAAIAGLEVVSDDEYSPIFPISGLRDPIAREYLLNDLAWHNWSYEEIESGAMLDALSRYHPSK